MIENCEVVAFLQHDESKEILNGDVLTLEDAVSSTVAFEDINVKLSPNPVQDYILIEGVNQGTARVFSQDGKLVHRFEINATNHNESFAQFGPGVYLINLDTEKGLATQKVIKK